MENIQFLKKSDLDGLIELYVGDIIDELNAYSYFQGFLSNSTNEKFYVDGYFKIEVSEWGLSSFTDNETESLVETNFIKALTGTKYSNNDNLINNTYNLNSICELDEPLYCYDEFKDLLNAYNIPLIRDINESPKKQFTYDPELINHKSNFTLEEASRIAANAPLKDQQGVFYSTSLVEHYEEVISECVKNKNQNGFHLITTELWCHSYSEDIGECSTRYNNGTSLKIGANVNLELTIVSKAEFLRWCKYMVIDTGLYNHQNCFDESIEALKAENEKLKTQIRPQGFQQAPPSITNSNSEEIKQLNKNIDKLNDELDLLKENSFPVMTSKLKAALKAQNNFWLSYDETNPPLQKAVTLFIEEELGLNSLKTNRDAEELTRAIQPEVIKRK